MASKVQPGPAPSRTLPAVARGPSPPRIAQTVGWLILATLCATASAASEARTGSTASAGAARAGRALQKMDLRDLLGRERWRQLQEARFQIHLSDLSFTPALADDPRTHQQVGRILLRSLLKGSQEAVERRMRLEERRDALRDRLRGRPRAGGDRSPAARPRLAAAPRFHLGHELWVGAKLWLPDSDSTFWSHADLRLGGELDGGNPSLKLAFQDDSRHGFLSYHFAHPERGEAIELRVGLSF